MKKIWVGIGVLFLFGMSMTMFLMKSNKNEKSSMDQTTNTSAFSLTSPAFASSQNIPVLYTCDGKNISPPLKIHKISPSAKSLVLLINDIDTPQGSWVHYVAWNIPVTTEIIKEGALQNLGVVGVNSYGKNTYGGPCPPNGSHRYVFTVYALDTFLVLEASASKQAVIDAMNTHVIYEASITGLYQRN